MKKISSRENETFKLLKSLSIAKGRAESGLCIIEGEKIIAENLESVSQVFIREGACGPVGIDSTGIEIIHLSPKLYDEISTLENCPGIMATSKIPPTNPVSYPLLVLDSIHDPGNMGTLLRTALAFGFRTVVCIFCVGVYSQKVIRSAMGAQFKLNTLTINHEGFLESAKTGELRDATFVMADLDGKPPDEIKPLVKGKKLALVLGNEGNGIDPQIKSLGEKVVTIPMTSDTDSLNVGVAGGILMYELKYVQDAQGGKNVQRNL